MVTKEDGFGDEGRRWDLQGMRFARDRNRDERFRGWGSHGIGFLRMFRGMGKWVGDEMRWLL